MPKTLNEKQRRQVNRVVEEIITLLVEEKLGGITIRTKNGGISEVKKHEFVDVRDK